MTYICTEVLIVIETSGFIVLAWFSKKRSEF
jgi:hypothetical protein